VRYSGIGNWPLLRSVTQSASLQHRYSGTYRAQYTTVTAAGEAATLSIGESNFVYRRPEFEVDASQVSERFEPLLGVDITWLGNLQTSLEWNTRQTTSLRTASLQIDEQTTDELSARVSYSKTGLRIPLLPIGRLNNRIQFTLTVERSVDDERSFNMRRALEQAASEGEAFDPAQAEQGDNVSITTQTTRLTVAPEFSYQFSNRVQGNFLVRYERFEGDGRQPSFTNINGAFRVRVSISEN
jgi:cell surface protein SprA